MARERDRSPAAVARAFLRGIDDREHDGTADNCTHCVAAIAALVQAVRRECRDVVSRSNGIDDALDRLRALNRAPRRGR